MLNGTILTFCASGACGVHSVVMRAALSAKQELQMLIKSILHSVLSCFMCLTQLSAQLHCVLRFQTKKKSLPISTKVVTVNTNSIDLTPCRAAGVWRPPLAWHVLTSVCSAGECKCVYVSACVCVCVCWWMFCLCLCFHMEPTKTCVICWEWWVTSDEWRVMSDEWWVTSYEWRVMSDEWW